MSWLPPSDGWLSITDTVALSYEIGWLRHRRIFILHLVQKILGCGALFQNIKTIILEMVIRPHSSHVILKRLMNIEIVSIWHI